MRITLETPHALRRAAVRAGAGGAVVVSARPVVTALPAYRPGRNPADLAREIGVERAVKLASNEVAFPPLPAVLEAIRTTAGEINRYPDNGASVLTAALAERYGVTPDQVATGCGAVTVCQQLAQAYNDPGTSLAFAWRSFEMYPLLASVAGARPVRVPLVPGTPGGPADTHDLDGLLAAIDATTRLVFVCNPNNPTGTAVRRAELERFLDAVPPETLVVLDEAYREFVTDPDVPDGVELMRGRPNVAVLRTFSKAWGLAGLRVGYLLAEDPAVAGAVRKTHVPFSVSMLAQAAAVAALASEAEVRERCAAVVAERDRLTAALRGRGLPVADSQANFVWLPLGEQAAEVAARLEARAVITRPFAGEGVRVTVGTPEEDDVFLAALDGVLDTLRGDTLLTSMPTGPARA
jgi:histidinol-phosphate aminotransferase